MPPERRTAQMVRPFFGLRGFKRSSSLPWSCFVASAGVCRPARPPVAARNRFRSRAGFRRRTQTPRTKSSRPRSTTMHATAGTFARIARHSIALVVAAVAGRVVVSAVVISPRRRRFGIRSRRVGMVRLACSVFFRMRSNGSAGGCLACGSCGSWA